MNLPSWFMVVLGAVAFLAARVPRVRALLDLPIEPEHWLLASLVLGILGFGGFTLEGKGGIGRVVAGIVAAAAAGTMFSAFFRQIGGH